MTGKEVFGPNLPCLVELNRKYYPENFFCKNHAKIAALARLELPQPRFGSELVREDELVYLNI